MFNYPQLVTTKSLSIAKINRKEWTKVTVSIYGDTRQQSVSVPISLVLALDYSGSMGLDNAYQEVSAAAKMIIGQLTPGTDSVAIITIKTNATIEVPLTSNFSGLPQKIDGFSPDGNTNIQDAFDKANSILIPATTPNKAVILISDGQVGFDQMNYINGNWQIPAAHSIHYNTIGYGPNVNEMLLDFLAAKTGGIYQKAPTKQDLQSTFNKALQESTKNLSTSNVFITEVVSNDLQIRPNSLAKTLTSILDDPIKFDADFKIAEQSFYNTRVLKVPKIISLGGQEMFSISFDVTSDLCSYKPLLISVDDLSFSAPTGSPAANVKYDCGKAAPQVDPLDQATLEINPYDVVMDKEFDETTKVVTLKFVNNYDHAIRNIRLIENPSPFFYVDNPIIPQPTQSSKKAAQWLINDVESNGERSFSIQFDDSPQQAQSKPPYPVDGRDTSLSYTVDVFLYEILMQDPVILSFESDLNNLTISSVTKQFFANYPNPSYRFDNLISISKSTPDPDFGWAIDAEIVHVSPAPPPASWKETVHLLVKKTQTGFWIYQTEWKFTHPPQRWTSASYNQH